MAQPEFLSVLTVNILVNLFSSWPMTCHIRDKNEALKHGLKTNCIKSGAERWFGLAECFVFGKVGNFWNRCIVYTYSLISDNFPSPSSSSSPSVG